MTLRLNTSERLSRLVSSYWFIPLLVTLGGVALAVSLLLLDERIRLERDDPLAVLRPSSAEGECDAVFLTRERLRPADRLQGDPRGGERAVRHACVVGSDRTLWHDPEFAVKQLVEIALRALSPAVNEPFTAITCIDRLTEGLAYVATAPAPRAAWPDDGGRHRVFAQPQPFETLLRASFDPIRIFAGPNPAVYARLLESLAELALVVRRASDHAQLQTQAEVILRASERTLVDGDDRSYVDSRYQQTVEQLAERATSKRR